MSSKHRITIERMTAEGLGMGRCNGKVIFVPYACPGDTLTIALTRAQKDYAIGRIIQVEKPGPHRITPRCEHHFRPGRSDAACGGCTWQQMDLEAQRASKRAVVRDCLFRIAKLREPRVEETLPSPIHWRYRNKVMIPWGASTHGSIHAGFFAHGSHDIVPFEDCPVQPELSVRLTHALCRLAQKSGWAIYDHRKNSGWLRHLYIRTASDGRALLTLVTKSGHFPDRKVLLQMLRTGFPEVIGVFQNIQPQKTTVVLGPKWSHVWGAQHLEEKLGVLRLRVSPASFLQVNTPACEELYELVRTFLTSGNWRPALTLDLYSGIGSIALWIANDTDRVIGLESNRQAARDALENARLNKKRNVQFRTGDVERQTHFILDTLEGTRCGNGRVAAILDPPRAGCSKTVLKTLRSPALKRIVYVSCNPATFARDADWLSRHGWRLSRVRPVDLFPQTYHIETVGLFERPDRTKRR